MGPVDAAIAHKFVKTLPVAEGPQKGSVHMIKNNVTEGKKATEHFSNGDRVTIWGTR